MISISISKLMSTSGVGFGTSGARGLVEKMTDQVCYAYTKAFLQYLISPSETPPGLPLTRGGTTTPSPEKEKAGMGSSKNEVPPPDKGEVRRGLTKVAIAGDLRPSTPRIMAAVMQAAEDMGIEPVNCGFIPSPAVALYGIQHNMPAIMVTGSHIPDDRNGIKFNTALGEITKEDEAGIRNQAVEIDDGLFDEKGMFITSPNLPFKRGGALESSPGKEGDNISSLPLFKGEAGWGLNQSAETKYLNRYLQVFDANALEGLSIGVYQHSGVARDLLVTLLESFGANVVQLGRSETFVPVDTEAIREEDIKLAKQWSDQYKLDAIVSTDGDADRPLVADEKGNWLRGDAAGSLCARFVGAKHIVTPVSSNTAVDKSGWFETVSRTKIGSPFVIAGMEQLTVEGKQQIVGYEANGGFLIQDDFQINGQTLKALPTRDAVIVILSLLISAKQQGITLSALAAQLPERYTYSDRIKDIPTEKSRALLANLNTGDDQIDSQVIDEFFQSQFGEVIAINRIDGLRITFNTGDIVHLRPSGNAPELRCYSEALSLEKAVSNNQSVMKTVKRAINPDVI